MRNIGITGTGYYLPSKVVTNKELEKTIDTTDEWIFSKVGVKERRIASNQEATSDLALYAAQNAIRDAGIHAEDVDLIVLATSSPDMIQPPTASIVQGKLGAYNAAAFDVGAVCAGFVYAISVGYSMMVAEQSYKHVLVVGAETYSRIMDWQDRSTCVFFGDGAGACILSEVSEGKGIMTKYLMTEGQGSSVIQFLAGGSRYPATHETLDKNMHRFQMEGKAVWDFATRVMPFAVRKVVKDAGLSIEDIDWIFPHQANINIIQKCFKDLGVPMEKTYTTIAQYANTSGASVIITLAEASKKGLLKKGDKIVLVGFGGGLSYGAMLLEWE
ncbi:MAG: 3-oxoacyl-ACP synthase [Spirochaetae bacterium HGW-Spirochaetae-2]|jgi:3-oxoacyl-[acyl-carrier-protein] synthase-3|nr:MAG: 3-oxoacyl-ACP synthase [Spirochaetae bacterium HGW-Spirochaetae-2]